MNEERTPEIILNHCVDYGLNSEQLQLDSDISFYKLASSRDADKYYLILSPQMQQCTFYGI